MASDLSKQVGKNSVSASTPSGSWRIDLQGKPHGGVASCATEDPAHRPQLQGQRTDFTGSACDQDGRPNGEEDCGEEAVRLSNFECDDPIRAITLRGLGFEWDLHNFAEFVGLRFDASTGTLELEWAVPADRENPWGSVDNLATGCRLRFAGVSSLHVQLPDSEACTELIGISRVVPEGSEYRFKSQWSQDDPSNLLVEFRGGRIEVGAESVALEGVGLEQPR
ncbi:MAG: hypothetical protein KA760_14530 [Steroidobacteraceae bacterium]|nr:hypothetical protein [Steroidobacteraceae bacterium]